MKLERSILAASVALWSISGCVAHRAATGDQSTVPVLDDAALSKIKVGSSNWAQVKEILGPPWRTTNYGETYCGCRHTDWQEVWEYRRVDSTGPYKLHVEFDENGIAQVLAVADRTGKVRALASADSKTETASAHAEHHSHADHGAPQ